MCVRGTPALQELRTSFNVHPKRQNGAALWTFQHSNDFRERALLAVNLGEDADATGAVYGQLAGASYGEDGIPSEWRARIARRDEIVNLARALFGTAGKNSEQG